MFGRVATVATMGTIATATDTHQGVHRKPFIIAIKTTMIIMMMVISSMFTLSVSSASQQGAATWYGESCPSTLTSTFRWICIILDHIYSFQGQQFWHHNNLNHDHSLSALELTRIRRSPQQMSVVGALSATQVFKDQNLFVQNVSGSVEKAN